MRGAETLAVPANDRIGLDEVECISPVGPDRAEDVPERPVSPFQRWSGGIALQDFDLVTKGQVLGDQGFTGPWGRDQCLQDDVEHHPGLSAGRRKSLNPMADEVWKGTPSRV